MDHVVFVQEIPVLDHRTMWITRKRTLKEMKIFETGKLEIRCLKPREICE